MSEDPLTCSSCGTRLPDGSPADAICPACLLEKGLHDDDSLADEVDSDAKTIGPDGQTSGRGKRPRRKSSSGEKKGSKPDSGSRFTPLATDAVSRLLPDFEIRRMIGAGGMGAVYEARQPELDRLVAIKLLPDFGDEDEQFRERFRREARTLANLNHPNIVTLHEFGESGGRYYFVMEYVDGVDLGQLIRSAEMQPQEALKLVPQICDALDYAHQEGVIHRDIKPGNILVSHKGQVKIADFGIAKIIGTQSAGAQDLTASGVAIGTPAYMAPEQLETPLEVDGRADIYSLGVVFYQMLTGELPIGKFPHPSEKVSVDIRLDEVVLRALEKEPERRYQHASEVKRGITDATTGRKVERLGDRFRSRLRRRRRNSLIAAAAAVILGLAAWGLYEFNKPRPLVNSLGMKFVTIPGTETKFSIWETRVRDYEAFTRDTDRPWEQPEFDQGTNHPAVRISHADAIDFCEWLTKKEIESGDLKEGERYRLPTDEEWSLAVGLGPEKGETPEEKHLANRSAYPWGKLAPAPAGAGNYPDTALRDKFSAGSPIPGYYDGFSTTAPVGSFPANDHGLFDMGGNVWEWTATDYRPNSGNPIMRGASWWNSILDRDWDRLLSSFRRYAGVRGSNDVGFRIVLDTIGGEETPAVEAVAATLIEAAEAGQVAQIRKFLDEGQSIEERDADGRTPLILAAMEGHDEAVALLLANQAPGSAVDKQGRSALYLAASSGHTSVVKRLIEHGENPSRAHAPDNQTALHAALHANRLETASHLIEAGADVNAIALTPSLDTPIKVAAMTAPDGSPIIAALLEAGADPNADRPGIPLATHVAAMVGKTANMKALLDAGADPDPLSSDPNFKGFTPLGYAARYGHIDIAELLIARGAEVEGRSAEGIPLHQAAAAGQDKLVSLLLEKGAVPDRKSVQSASTALHALATGVLGPNSRKKIAKLFNQTGTDGPSFQATAFRNTLLRELESVLFREEGDHRAIVRQLIQAGLDPDSRDLNGFSPISLAALNGMEPVVDELLEHEPNLDQRDTAGFTPLLSAAEYGFIEIVRLLVEAGADLRARVEDTTDSQGNAGSTALHFAAANGDIDMAVYLLEQGVPVDVRDDHGTSPLIVASIRGFPELVTLFLEREADVTATLPRTHNSGGANALMMACFGWCGPEGLTEDAQGEFGERADADLRSRGGFAKPDFTATVRLLIDRGIDLDHPDNDGSTALFYASRNDNIDAVTLLLEAGADPEIPDRSASRTALLLACERGAVECVRAFVAAGASLEYADAAKAGPLHWAATTNRPEVIEVLVEGGAPLEGRDIAYNTPLLVAAGRGYLESVRVLCQLGARTDVRDLSGLSPAESAKVRGHPEVAGFLNSLAALPDSSGSRSTEKPASQ